MMPLGVVADSTGWKSYYSPCGCTYSMGGAILGCCHEHQPFAEFVDDAASILVRMRMFVKAQAEARELAREAAA